MAPCAGILAAAPEAAHADGLKVAAVCACHDLGMPSVVAAHHGGLVCAAGALLDGRNQICVRRIEHAAGTRCCANQLPLSTRSRTLVSILPLPGQRGLRRLLRRQSFSPYVRPAPCRPLRVQERWSELESLASKADAIVVPLNAVRAAQRRQAGTYLCAKR